MKIPTLSFPLTGRHAALAALAAALACPTSGWAGASAAVRLSHLSFQVFDLTPSDGNVAFWSSVDAMSSATTFINSADPLGNPGPWDACGGLVGQGCTASVTFGAASGRASIANQPSTGFIGGAASLAVDGEVGTSVVDLIYSRFTIAPGTRLVVYGWLDIGVTTDGNNDVVSYGSVSFQVDALGANPGFQTYGNAGPYLRAGEPGSDGFSGVFGWYLDNLHPAAERTGYLRVDIGAQTFGGDGSTVGAGSVPALPLLAAPRTSPPDVPAAFIPAAPIPEPGTWAMLLAGLSVLGLAARRRHPLSR